VGGSCVSSIEEDPGEIYKVQGTLAEVEKMRDGAGQVAAKARNIARKVRGLRLVDIAREGVGRMA
jgi:hypothetical protein